MSNKVVFQPTEFRDVRSGEVSLGVRVYDEYGNTYTNLWESIPDDDFDIIRLAEETMEHNQVFIDLMESLVDNEAGITVGETFYGFDEIQDLLTELGYDLPESDDDDADLDSEEE